jgi:iron complex transport system ATP-binding protein
MHGQPAIRLTDIRFVRDERAILDRISWTVPAGGCVAILGPNGCGKSTLARIIAGHLWPSSGEVEVLGRRFGEVDLNELRHDLRLIQPAGPFDVDGELSALEAVLTGFFGTIGLYDPVDEPMRRRAREVLELVGLSAVVSHRYATLSSGEKVRCLIARALVARPKLLLLDEPTAGLDLRAREQVLATVQAMFDAKARGEIPPTVVMITHHPEELPPATGRVLLMLSRVYGCPVEVRLSNGRYYLEVHPGGWTDLLK